MTAVARTRSAGLRPPPRPPLRANPDVVLAVIVLGALAAVALWWKDTPGFVGLGGWLTNAGRITGLLAGYAIAVELALMARVPAIERGVGTDRLARWHAMGGRYTVSLAVAHTLLIIWGYAVEQHTNVVHQSAQFVLTYPDVLMATVALGLLVAVGVASARAARCRLKYETWHFIHLYTYLAVGLTFAHQFSTGASFGGTSGQAAFARLAWSSMYIVVAAALVWFRVVVPVVNALRHQFRVTKVVAEGPDVVSVHVAGRDVPRLAAEPGQFFRWRFLTRDLWWAANPYSLSAAPRSDRLRITVRVAGEHSAALRTLRPGTRVLAEGPYGGFTPALRTRKHVLLVAAGVGISPIRAILEALPQHPGDVTLVYRASTAEDLVLRSELDPLAAHTGARLHYLIGSRSSEPASWLGRERLPLLVPGLANHDVFMCGPDAFTESLTAELRAAGVPRRRIHHESFAF